MRCRKNLRVLFAEHNAASPADRPNTALMKLKGAILALKDPATHPSQLILRPDVAAAIANDIAMNMLPTGATLASRYDDFVWVHHQVMMQGPNGQNGPNLAHRGPAFAPWHRELLKLYEQELAAAAGDPELTLPYWDWTKDQSAADAGFPFTLDFLGGDGAGNPNDQVTTGAFAQASGWALNLDEEGFGFLRRHFGGDGPGLPTAASVKAALAITTYDSSPWNILSASASSFRNTLEGFVGPRQIHNAVHRWVDGSMQPGTSPNDPVFFFHHCNIDRLWAVWEQKHPGVALYLPDNSTPAASGLTRLSDNMATFGRTATDRYFGLDVAPAGVTNSKAITWYDSDLPELNNETGANLAFVGIPEGLTTYKAVKFRVTGCRPVHFRINGLPTGQFGLTTMGTEFVANPDESAPFYYGYVWVQLVAVAGQIAPSAVDIHAYIVDDEGYYAPTEGGEFALGDFHVTLTATSVPRENNSVALVLDRSGSMASPAGGSSTKTSLLRNAVSVFNTLMLANDEIALVSFDDQVATPAPMQAASAGAVAPVLAGGDLDPRGLTWIGGGIQQGFVELGAATHTNRSVLILTDGIENIHPYVGELPGGTITDRTYAIGFGLPADISTAVLQQITANTHGDLIITGAITTAEQGFNLTKYFVQMLAGVTRMSVLLDPQGALFIGSEDVIPFELTDADIYADVIVLCPAPELIDFTLITPAGEVLDAAGGTNHSYTVGPNVACYRVTFPAVAADPLGSHAGGWKAILRLRKREEVEKRLTDRELNVRLQESGVGDSLPYSLIAHAYSNLQFEARLQQDSFKPGAKVRIEAELTTYGVAATDAAVAWVEIFGPNEKTDSLPMERIGDGSYSAAFVASSPGIYMCRVRVEGYFLAKDKFTREKTLTAATWYGDDDGKQGRNDGLDELLRCLRAVGVGDERMADKVHELGLDAEGLHECLDQLSTRAVEPSTATTSARPSKTPSARRTVKLKAAPRAKLVEQPPAVKRAESPPPTIRQGPRIIHMFTPPQENPPGMAIEAEPAAKPVGQAFPRIVRMFTHPDEVAVEEHEADE